VLPGLQKEESFNKRRRRSEIMCRSLIVCLALVFGLVSASFADILIGNFEEQMSDNWVAGPEGAPVTLWSTTNGVTLDDMALCVKTNGGYWTLQWNAPVVVDMSTITAVKLDLTMIASEWVNGGWTAVDKLAINSDGYSGWQEYTNTSSTGNSTWGPWAGDVTKTITWDIPDMYRSENATYLQFIIALQNPSQDIGCFHIDNVWLISEYDFGDLTGGGSVLPPCVPEPTTIALLGLGSLALLRKKQ
jgi:hypothetical protein